MGGIKKGGLQLSHKNRHVESKFYNLPQGWSSYISLLKHATGPKLLNKLNSGTLLS